MFTNSRLKWYRNSLGTLSSKEGSVKAGNGKMPNQLLGMQVMRKKCAKNRMEMAVSVYGDLHALHIGSLRYGCDDAWVRKEDELEGIPLSTFRFLSMIWR